MPAAWSFLTTFLSQSTTVKVDKGKTAALLPVYLDTVFTLCYSILIKLYHNI
jgi:hypothetical protein